MIQMKKPSEWKLSSLKGDARRHRLKEGATLRVEPRQQENREEDDISYEKCITAHRCEAGCPTRDIAAERGTDEHCAHGQP